MISLNKIKTIAKKIYWKEILAVFLLLVAIFFFRSERRELLSIFPHLQKADPTWVITGIAVTVLYILLQSLMYISAFNAIDSSLT